MDDDQRQQPLSNDSKSAGRGKSPSSQWYYLLDGQRQGPISGDRLHELVRTGMLSPEDLVWREGMDDWLPARSLGLTAATGRTTPPPPPPSAPPVTRAVSPSQPTHATYRPRAKPGASSRRLRTTQIAIWTSIAVVGVVVCGLWIVFASSSPRGSGQVSRNVVGRDRQDRARSVPGASPRRSAVDRPAMGQSKNLGTVGDDDRDLPTRPPRRRSDPLLKPSESAAVEKPSSTDTASEPSLRRAEATDPQVRIGSDTSATSSPNASMPPQEVGPGTLYQELVVQRSPKFSVQGLDMDQKIQYRIVSRLELGPRGDDGKRKVSQFVEDTRLVEADDLSRSTFQSSLDDLRRQQFTLILNQDNEVIDFIGFKKNVIPLPVNLLDSKGFMMTSVIDEDGWKELAELSFFKPRRPSSNETSESQSWMRQMTHDWSPLGSWYGTTTFTPLQSSNALQPYQFTHAMTYNPPKEGGATPFKISSAEFHPLLTSGTIQYDPQLGRVVEAEETFHVRGSVGVELLGQAVPIELEEKQVLTVRITSQAGDHRD
jgi:hypothetical protein